MKDTIPHWSHIVVNKIEITINTKAFEADGSGCYYIQTGIIKQITIPHPTASTYL